MLCVSPSRTDLSFQRRISREKRQISQPEKTCRAQNRFSTKELAWRWLAPQTQRRPYGELQAVEHLRCLGCCHCFQFAETKVSPRCFCAGDLVAEIVKELKVRMKARGDTGQIKRAEQLLGEIQILKAQAKNTDAKLDAILKHLNIEAPPPTAAATVTSADAA